MSTTLQPRCSQELYRGAPLRGRTSRRFPRSRLMTREIGQAVHLPTPGPRVGRQARARVGPVRRLVRCGLWHWQDRRLARAAAPTAVGTRELRTDPKVGRSVRGARGRWPERSARPSLPLRTAPRTLRLRRRHGRGGTRARRRRLWRSARSGGAPVRHSLRRGERRRRSVGNAAVYATSPMSGCRTR